MTFFKGNYFLDSFTEYIRRANITPLMLKIGHKPVKAHYVGYKKLNSTFLCIDDNRVNTVVHEEIYPANLLFYKKSAVITELAWEIDISRMLKWHKPVITNKKSMGSSGTSSSWQRYGLVQKVVKSDRMSR